MLVPLLCLTAFMIDTDNKTTCGVGIAFTGADKNNAYRPPQAVKKDDVSTVEKSPETGSGELIGTFCGIRSLFHISAKKKVERGGIPHPSAMTYSIGTPCAGGGAFFARVRNIHAPPGAYQK